MAKITTKNNEDVNDNTLRKRTVKSKSNLLKTFFSPNSSEENTTKTNNYKEENSRFYNFLKILVIIILLPPILNYSSIQREVNELRKNETLFDIGFNQKLFMSCLGPLNSDFPTVILNAPTGQTSDVWLKIQREISSLTRVCLYDRGGLGFSEAPMNFNMSDPGESAVALASGPASTALRMVHDLHRLLTFSHPQKKPFILVGSEIGATVSVSYAKIHPEQVSGLVLIDPLTSDVYKGGEWLKLLNESVLPSLKLLEIGALLGINRLLILANLLNPTLNPWLNNEQTGSLRQKHLLCNPRHVGAMIEEFLALETSASQLDRILKTDPNKKTSPLDTLVMTGNYYDELYPISVNRAWSKGAQSLIEALPGCKHVVINSADRHMIYQKPELVSAPIIRMIKRLKK